MQERTIRTQMLLGAAAVERLHSSHVAVFGLGGVGSWCAEALARSGIGRLTLIDQDTVSESNINRQLCALYSTVGKYKTEVMASRINDIAPDIELNCINGHYDASSRDIYFQDYDFVVDAIDLVSCKIDLICTCIERGIPIISALGTGNKRDATQLTISDISKTYGCAFARIVRRELKAKGITHHTVVFSPEEAMTPEQVELPPPGRRSVPGSLIWVPATAGFILCQHVVESLSEERSKQ